MSEQPTPDTTDDPYDDSDFSSGTYDGKSIFDLDDDASVSPSGLPVVNRQAIANDDGHLEVDAWLREHPDES